MKELAESDFFIIAVIFALGVVPLLGLWRLRATWNKKNAARPAVAGNQYDQGLRHPDYAAFATHFGCEPPPGLRQLYEGADSNLEGDFELKLPAFPKPFFVAYFLGVAEENMSLVGPGSEGFFAFASDGSGNRYLVNPGEADPSVYFYDHEKQKSEPLKLPLSQFLAAKRIKSTWYSPLATAR